MSARRPLPAPLVDDDDPPWPDHLREVQDRYIATLRAVEAEATPRLRACLVAGTVAPLPAHSPRSAWQWPATVARLVEGATLATLAARYGRSRERVRQAIARTLLDWARRDAPDLRARLEAARRRYDAWWHGDDA